MSTKETTRSQTADAVVADARAMVEAVQGDPEVSAKLGSAYVATVNAQIDRVVSSLGDAHRAAEAQSLDSAHVAQTSANLLLVMKDVRDDVQIAQQSAEVQQAFGRGAHWDATQPDALALAGHDMASAIAKYPDAVAAAGIDAQHVHDLTELSAALGEAHAHHVSVRRDRGDTTAARGLALAALKASAHHIRLVARRVHRSDPQKLAHFASPIAHHQVVHKAKAASAAGATSVAKGETPAK